MIAMLLVVADTTNDALLYAFWLQADHVEYLSDVALTLGALRIFEVLSQHLSLIINNSSCFTYIIVSLGVFYLQYPSF
jgi:hypothetical protein